MRMVIMQIYQKKYPLREGRFDLQQWRDLPMNDGHDREPAKIDEPIEIPLEGGPI